MTLVIGLLSACEPNNAAMSATTFEWRTPTHRPAFPATFVPDWKTPRIPSTDLALPTLERKLPPSTSDDTVPPTPQGDLLTPIPIGTASPVVVYAEWPTTGYPHDQAHIVAIELQEKDLLRVRVAYSGGCRNHRFTLVAWGAFLASSPPQVVLHLAHDANEESCTAAVEDDLWFDLEPLEAERSDPSEFPAILRVFEPMGAAFADEPHQPLIEWP